MPNRIDVKDDEIFELREQGLSYPKIVDYFKNKGIKVSFKTISRRCKKIYEEKGKKEPRITIISQIEIPEEEIFNLREQGLTYKEIANYFNSNGVNVSPVKIRKICKKIYEEKEKEEPKSKTKTRNQKEITDEEIFNLREQGLTYDMIAKHFNDKGIKISNSTIRKRCKKIYQDKGKDEPKAKRKTANKIKIPEEEIYNLKTSGFSYEEIAEYLNFEGKIIDVDTIRETYKKMLSARKKQEDEIRMNETIYNLKEKGLSLKDISEYFKSTGKEVAPATVRQKM